MSASVEHALERLGVRAVRQGSRLWAERCPLPTHPAHNPSHAFKNFFARADGHPRAGQWACFSCGAGGKLVELVMRVRGLEFREALAWLRDVADAPAPAPVVRVRYAVLGARERRFAMPGGAEFPPWEAWNSVPRRYLLGRGVTAEQAARWGIGYALSGRLDGRVVFPIVDQRGELANYAARTFAGHETRYLAADEREGPDLSAMLGEAFWPRDPAERARSTLVVFEGAVSGMALERALAGRPGVYLGGLQGADAGHPRRATRLQGFGRIASAADPDEAGDRVTEEIRAAARRVPVLRLAYPRRGVDAADEDPASLARALAECLGR